MDFNNFDFSNSAIIKPPTKEERNQHNNDSVIEQKLILIDSRDRNINLYPNNNDFVIELDEPINDVSELELVSANMPINSYNINEHNNRLYFFENTIDNVTQFPKAYDHTDNAGLYDSDGKVKADKIYYIKMIPNNYPNPKSITDYLKFNNHYVYSLETNQITGTIAAFYVSYNNLSSKYNILIFTGGDYSGSMLSEYICHNKFDPPVNLTTAVAEKNSIIFRGDKITYNGKTMYNYLPNSAHEIFGFDLNYGFSEYNDNKLSRAYYNYNLSLDPDFDGLITTAALNLHYDAPSDNPCYSIDGSNIITRKIKGVNANLDSTKNIYINISNTMATNKVNEYVLLHLPSLPTMANKIASNSIVQNAYTKLHLGTGSTRNVFFGRIKAFTNVYMLKPSVKLSRIRIKLTDYNGNLFDFNNFNFTLTFSIMYNKQPKFYNY